MHRVLEVSGVSKAFGGVRALSDVSLQVSSGELVGLIGPNGAGKSTLFNLVTGMAAPDRGTLRVLDWRGTRARPDELARMGVARTFQLVQLFESMTVRQNVATALMAKGLGRRQALLDSAKFAEAVGLAGVVDRLPGELPHGSRRRAELARAMATSPRLLLVDEVMAGLSIEEKDEIVAVLLDLAASGVAVLAVEHDLSFVLGRCDRVIVLNEGRVIADGDPAEVAGDPEVVSAYIGRTGSGERGARV